MPKRLIYTIGTSTRSIEEFIEILKKYNIKIAIDVRSFPKSKKFPHFNKENIKTILENESIQYVYLGKELGGFRKGGYESYMETEEFKKGIEKIEKTAIKDLSIFFCAEKIFFRCHRRFISEELVKRGWKVVHIIEKNRIYEHQKRDLSQKVFDFI